ncbi:MAG: hypothetical protein KGJ23_09180 [Euryarchaeota archaeon]|nr:hypothetical protein [Euryarchaeota archaeon]MDE1836777.1 hypothetical protein [Euryarchaeota archaeon]MDE1879795.1 hypothetical protein [Euryarchaeota archaeon]MDE2044761.1 hypothetical protein [Thermoplasmata archaeon]
MAPSPVLRKMVRLPAANLLVLLGALLTTLGAAGSGWRYLAAGGAILALGLVLFWDEGRWSRALVRPGAPLPSEAPLPWWRRPRAYPGKWLCTACGWREEKSTSLCPRCGRPLVRLPAPSA